MSSKDNDIAMLKKALEVQTLTLALKDISNKIERQTNVIDKKEISTSDLCSMFGWLCFFLIIVAAMNSHLNTF